MRKSYQLFLKQFWIAGLLLVALLSMSHAFSSTEPAQAAADPQYLNPQFHENVITFWDEVALNAVRNALPGPPVVARSLAMVHTAQYEAWSQYDAVAVGTLLGASQRRPVDERTLTNKTIAMSYAAYRVLSDLFPNQQSDFDSIMSWHHLDPAIQTTNPATPAGMGNLAAAVVLHYRHHDGANQLGDLHRGSYSDYTGYSPVNTPTTVVDLNHWQPLQTPNGSFQGGCLDTGSLITQTVVAPHWGHVIPFALDDGELITPTRGPARYPSPEFTLQAQEVLTLSAMLGDREKAITEYWADGPGSVLPPGHWAFFAQYVSGRDHHSLDEDAKLFFALTNANHDAGILAWKVKRIYDSVRPITAIRQLFSGQQVMAWGGPFSGTQMIDGSTWQPYQLSCFVTPAFQGFISGHSTFSAASAEVLRSFTGSDHFGHSTQFNYSPIEPGVVPAAPITLNWETFSQAADEAGLSRRYGGIHFADDDLMGRTLGRQVGKRVWDKAETFFAGTAQPVADYNQKIVDFIAIDDFRRIFKPYQVFMPIVSQNVNLVPMK